MVQIRYKMYLSPTAINTYLYCPRKFYFRYIEKRVQRISKELICGSLVHRVLYKFNHDNADSLLASGSLDFHFVLLRIFKEEWRKASSRLLQIGMDRTSLFSLHDEYQLMVINYGFWLEQSGLSSPERSEAYLISKRLGVRGVADAIHKVGRDLIIVDYKTSRRKHISKDIEIQAMLYALLYYEMHHKYIDEVWIHFLRYVGDPEAIRIDLEMLDYARGLVEKVHLLTASRDIKDYPCRCGGRCQRDFIDDRG